MFVGLNMRGCLAVLHDESVNSETQKERTEIKTLFQ